jgi:hypothetical protein
MIFSKHHPSDDTLGLVCRRRETSVEVFTDYDAVLERFPDRSEEWRQEFIGMEEDEDCYKLYIGETKQRR